MEQTENKPLPENTS